MRILLSEGSGLTSRQVATRLGELGHEVEVLSSTQICLPVYTSHSPRPSRPELCEIASGLVGGSKRYSQGTSSRCSVPHTGAGCRAFSSAAEPRGGDGHARVQLASSFFCREGYSSTKG